MVDGSSWAGGSSRFGLVRVEAAVVASQGSDSERVGLDERSNFGGLASRKGLARLRREKWWTGEEVIACSLLGI